MMCCASFFININAALLYSYVSKKSIESQNIPMIKVEKNYSWIMLDFLFINFVYYSQFYERFLLESWRLKDPKNVPYSYDNNMMVYHALSLFSIVIISKKIYVIESMKLYGVYIMKFFFYVMVFTSYNFIYRQRMIFGISLILVGVVIFVYTGH